MDNQYRPILQTTFKARWCGNCQHAYAVQVDRREGTFISAQAHIKGGIHSMTVVTHCVECNVPLDQAWLDNSYTSKPEPDQFVAGRHDSGDDINGVVV